MIDPNLVGTWSADIMYGPGAQSDEVFIFQPDGTGWFETWNWALCEVEFFRWDVPEPDRLILHGYRGLQRSSDAKRFDEVDPLWPELDTPLQIQMENTPSGKMMRVMRIKMYTNIPDQWQAFGYDADGLLVIRMPQAGPIR